MLSSNGTNDGLLKQFGELPSDSFKVFYHLARYCELFAVLLNFLEAMLGSRSLAKNGLTSVLNITCQYLAQVLHWPL